ncbi:MAG: PEGA domain-containing protein [Deltaproteobacteria bacterium]|nr:PEGA domain-containing protein [Deltaproteobacteria bacterium]
MKTQIPLPSLKRGSERSFLLPGRGTGGVSTRFLRIVAAFVLSFLLTACFETIAPDVGPRGTLRFKSNQKDAILEIDDTRLGPIGMFEKTGVLLKPGAHRVVVHQKGYFREYRLITVTEDQLQMVDITMTPVPD